MLKLLLLALSLIALGSSRTSEKLKVSLSDGSRMVGRYLTSDSGRGIRAFMGVPYAEAPVGDLRFKVKKKCAAIKSETFLLVRFASRRFSLV